MHFNAQIVVLMALTTGAGWLMLQSGMLKNLLEWRRDRRVCPSCGRNADTCGCNAA